MRLHQASLFVSIASLLGFAACGGTGNTGESTPGAGGSGAGVAGGSGAGNAAGNAAGQGTGNAAGQGTGNAAGQGTGNAAGQGTGNNGGQGTGNNGGFASGGAAGFTPGGGAGGACTGVTQKAEAKFLPADIIWVVDTSLSMDFESKFVQSKLNTFAKGILDVGIDVHVALISNPSNTCLVPGMCPGAMPFIGICIDPPLGKAACPAPGPTKGQDSNPPVYTHVYQQVMSNDGLNILKSSYPKWKGALRPDSTKTIIIVTDDDATAAPYGPGSAGSAAQGAKKWLDDMKALDPALLGSIKVSGIYCFTKCPEAAAIGTVWDALVDQTGGVKGDLCKQDFQPVFNDIAKGVVAGTKLDCTWKIPPPPQGEVINPQKVNVEFTPGSGAPEYILQAPGKDQCDPAKGGWYYDDPINPKSIIACPASCTHIQADPSGKIDIELGCETRVIPK